MSRSSSVRVPAAAERAALAAIPDEMNAVNYVRFHLPFGRLAAHRWSLRTLGASLSLERGPRGFEPARSLVDGASLVLFPQLVLSPRLPDGSTLDLVGILAERARRAGARVVYSVDDHLQTIEEGNPSYEVVSGSLSNVEKMLGLSDAVIAATDVLGKALAPYGKPVHVLPNAIDPSRWRTRPRLSREARIGWAGSSSHLEDLRMVLPALRRLRKRADFRFVLFGIVPRPLEIEAAEVRRLLPSLGGSRRATALGFLDLVDGLKPLRFTHVPYVPMEAFFEALPSLDLDIGICPLVDTPFNRARSALKFYEYAAAGTATLASDVTPYRGEVSRTVPNAPEDWCSALEELLRDASLRERVLEEQRRFVFARRNIDVACRDWARALDEILGG